MPEQNKLQRDVVLTIVILIVLGGLYYFYRTSMMVPAPQKTVSKNAPASSMQVTDLMASAANNGGVKSVPTGFPSSIPVELPNLKESYVFAYNNTHLTQYTVSYTSIKSVSSLWDTYNTYLKSNRYSLNPKLTSKTRGTLSGTLVNATLIVVIAQQKTGSLVTITYVVQK